MSLLCVSYRSVCQQTHSQLPLYTKLLLDSSLQETNSNPFHLSVPQSSSFNHQDSMEQQKDVTSDPKPASVASSAERSTSQVLSLNSSPVSPSSSIHPMLTLADSSHSASDADHLTPQTSELVTVAATLPTLPLSSTNISASAGSNKPPSNEPQSSIVHWESLPVTVVGAKPETADLSLTLEASPSSASGPESLKTVMEQIPIEYQKKEIQAQLSELQSEQKDAEQIPDENSLNLDRNQAIADVPLSGLADEQQSQGILNSMMPTAQVSDSAEFNILMIGQTGVGKSTAINAFSNYCKFPTFEDAAAGDLINHIPTHFSLPNPENDDSMEIWSGKADPNERHGEDGRSVTQNPMGYVFPFEGGRVRIIDTPGSGDTSGPEVDNQNFQQILKYLHHHKAVHAICIVIKSTENRRTPSFRFCLNNLLTFLHKSACKNIFFLFTHARVSGYGVGEGYTTLRRMLEEEFPDAEIKLKIGQNCFSIDSESYRFLVARKTGYQFSSKQFHAYRESWEHSAKQTRLMMDRILSLEPHQLDKTLSMYNARKLILEMADPVIKLQLYIKSDIEKIQAKTNQIESLNKTRAELLRQLNIEVETIEKVALSQPATVCTGSKCADKKEFQGNEVLIYRTRCHDQCNLKNIPPNIQGHQELINCTAFCRASLDPISRANCRQCGCHLDEHMQIKYEYVSRKRTGVDSTIQARLAFTERSIAQHRAQLGKMVPILVLQEELKVVQDLSAKIAYILAASCDNVSFGKFLEPHLNLMIEEEQKKRRRVTGYPDTMYKSLLKMKLEHEKAVHCLTADIEQGRHPMVTIEQLREFRHQLRTLKHSGVYFAQMISCEESKKEKETIFEERMSDPITLVVPGGECAPKDA